MTTDEYIKKLREKLNDLVQDNKPLAKAVATTHADQMTRIYEKGEDATGGKIGDYNSTDPIYVDPKISPRSFSPKGKTGETKFKNGKSHKTGYFQSYKAYRASQGRETGFVNLRLHGQLQKDMSNSLTRLSPGIWVTGTKNPANSKKAEGAEKKYGKIFNLSHDEKKVFKEILKDELLIALT